MKFGLILSLFVGVLSSEVFAGGSSTVGPALCSYAKYWCKGSDSNINACIFDSTQTSEPWVLVVNDDSASQSFYVNKINPADGMLGAPLEYRSAGLEIKICTTCAEQVGELTVPQFQIANQKMNCRGEK